MALQDRLAKFTSRNTLPIIFVSGIAIGGPEQVIQFHSGGILLQFMRDRGLVGTI